MMYQQYYRRQRLKSAIIILLLFIAALFPTYFIYQKFNKQRNKDIESGNMEVIFHEKMENKISLEQFNPVSDAVGLTSPANTFTVTNNTANTVNYKIVLEKDEEEMLECGCLEKQIPHELIKLSFRKDHLAPNALVLSEVVDNVLLTDTLEPTESEDYSVRLWVMRSTFTVDRTSHFHGILKVVEE